MFSSVSPALIVMCSVAVSLSAQNISDKPVTKPERGATRMHPANATSGCGIFYSKAQLRDARCGSADGIFIGSNQYLTGIEYRMSPVKAALASSYEGSLASSWTWPTGNPSLGIALLCSQFGRFVCYSILSASQTGNRTAP